MTDTGYLWPERCCMSTLLRLTEMLGGRTAPIYDSLAMGEGEAIKHYLRTYGTLGNAYLQTLLMCGWRTVSDHGTVAILDGEVIRTVNGGEHRPKGRIQVLAFATVKGFQIWTPPGLSEVDLSSGETIVAHRFEMRQAWT